MGILSALGIAKEQPQKVEAQYAPAIFDNPMGAYWNGNNYLGQYGTQVIDRQSAIAVPAVQRARNLICGIAASIPMQTYSVYSGEELPNAPWVDQPDIRQPRSITISWLIDSLLMYGVGYLMIDEVYSDGRPSRFSWVQNTRITVKLTQLGTEVDYYMLNNVKLPMSGVGSLVTFQSILGQGILNTGGRTIQAALDIERATAIASSTPIPSGYLKSSGADLPQDQIQGLLASWKQARTSRSTAFLTSTLEYVPTSFSPKDMTYNDSAQYMATQISRLTNVPAYFLSAEVFRSNTYTNNIDERKNLIDFSIRPFLDSIQDRLSMDDITPRGTAIRFEVSETFLRDDPITRLTVIEKMLQLNLISVEQAREMEDLTPEGLDSMPMTNAPTAPTANPDAKPVEDVVGNP